MRRLTPVLAILMCQAAGAESIILGDRQSFDPVSRLMTVEVDFSVLPELGTPGGGTPHHAFGYYLHGSAWRDFERAVREPDLAIRSHEIPFGRGIVARWGPKMLGGPSGDPGSDGLGRFISDSPFQVSGGAGRWTVRFVLPRAFGDEFVAGARYVLVPFVDGVPQYDGARIGGLGSASFVPEPGGLTTLGIGLALVSAAAWRRHDRRREGRCFETC